MKPLYPLNICHQKEMSVQWKSPDTMHHWPRKGNPKHTVRRIEETLSCLQSHGGNLTCQVNQSLPSFSHWQTQNPRGQPMIAIPKEIYKSLLETTEEWDRGVKYKRFVPQHWCRQVIDHQHPSSIWELRKNPPPALQPTCYLLLHPLPVLTHISNRSQIYPQKFKPLQIPGTTLWQNRWCWVLPISD